MELNINKTSDFLLLNSSVPCLLREAEFVRRQMPRLYHILPMCSRNILAEDWNTLGVQAYDPSQSASYKASIYTWYNLVIMHYLVERQFDYTLIGSDHLDRTEMQCHLEKRRKLSGWPSVVTGPKLKRG